MTNNNNIQVYTCNLSCITEQLNYTENYYYQSPFIFVTGFHIYRINQKYWKVLVNFDNA